MPGLSKMKKPHIQKKSRNRFMILKNILYILKLAFRAAPLLVVAAVVVNVFQFAVNTFISLFFVRYIIEAMQMGRSFQETFLLILGMFAAKALSALSLNYVFFSLAPRENVKITAALMKMLYGQAVSMDLSCYEDPDFYDTYTRANEQVAQQAQSVIENATWMVGVIVSLAMIIVTMALSEPLIILVAVIPVVLDQFLAKRFSEHKFNRDKNTAYERRQMDYVSRIVYQQEYAKEVRLSNIFAPIMDSFARAAESMRQISKVYGWKLGAVRFVRTILSELVVYLAVQGIIVYRYLVDSAYTLGVLTTLLNGYTQFTYVLGNFTWARDRLYQCGMFVENFRLFMEYETKMPENPEGKEADPAKSDICFKNVSFSYKEGSAPVLKDLNMTIGRGQKIAIVGHNGAGKSTFVKLLMRLYDVTEGSIEVGGTDIREYRLGSYRKLFGTVFQDFKIFAASITENVLLRRGSEATADDDRERVRSALRASGLLGKAEGLENGLDSQLTREFDDEGILLSGGEFQKLAIARVFAKDCEICILDEPSSALDPISESEVFENMLKACEGKTVIFISHRLSTTVLADRIYLLEEGRILESGSHRELMDQKGRYAQMYHMQAKRYQEEMAYKAPCAEEGILGGDGI